MNECRLVSETHQQMRIVGNKVRREQMRIVGCPKSPEGVPGTDGNPDSTLCETTETSWSSRKILGISSTLPGEFPSITWRPVAFVYPIRTVPILGWHRDKNKQQTPCMDWPHGHARQNSWKQYQNKIFRKPFSFSLNAGQACAFRFRNTETTNPIWGALL